MFSFLKRSKKSAKEAEKVYFVGKNSVDAEYIYIGEDEHHVQVLKNYIDTLHMNILNEAGNSDALKQTPVYYFFDFDQNSQDLSVGRLGPNKDKSDRDNIFLLTRYVCDLTVKTYPLFTPSLYSDFFNDSDNIVHTDLKHFTLEQFKQRIKSQSQSSLYLDNKEVLNYATDALYGLNINGYLTSLLKHYPAMEVKHLMGMWAFWRETINALEDKQATLPLLIELPNNDNLHHYISFICQLLEPLFESLAHYRVFWWRDQVADRSWCLITDLKREANVDLMLFNVQLMTKFDVLTYNGMKINDASVSSLFDALQILIEN